METKDIKEIPLPEENPIDDGIVIPEIPEEK